MSTNESDSPTNEELDGIAKAETVVLRRLNDILYRTPQHYAFNHRQTELGDALDLVERILTVDYAKVLDEYDRTINLVNRLQKEKQVVQNFFNISS